MSGPLLRPCLSGDAGVVPDGLKHDLCCFTSCHCRASLGWFFALQTCAVHFHYLGSDQGSGYQAQVPRSDSDQEAKTSALRFFFSKTIKKKWHSKRVFLSSCIYIYKKKKNHKGLMFKTVRLKRWWNFVSWYRNTFCIRANLDTERLKSVCVDVCKYIFTYKQIKSYSLDSFGQISASALTNAPPLLWPSSSLSQSGDFLEWFKVWVPFWLPWKRMRSRFGSNLAVKYYNHPGIETITLQKKKNCKKKFLQKDYKTSEHEL